MTDDDYLGQLIKTALYQTYTIPVLNTNGEIITYLNGRLAEERGLSERDVERLVLSHQMRHEICQKMAASSDKQRIRELAKRITKLEYCQQTLWGFPKDETYHNWYTVPHCSCPKSDNDMRKGTKYWIRNDDCIVHGE